METVTIAVPWTDKHTGESYLPGDMATLHTGQARRLIRDGWARTAPALVAETIESETDDTESSE